MFTIEPLVGVNDVRYGMTIDDMTRLGYQEHGEKDEDLGWRTFQKEAGLFCYTEDDAVKCIACHKDCCVNGIPLIGQAPESIIAALGEPDEIGDAVYVDEATQQTPYEFYSLGLQIWFEEGLSVSVYCNKDYAE